MNMQENSLVLFQKLCSKDEKIVKNYFSFRESNFFSSMERFSYFKPYSELRDKRILIDFSEGT